jgi:hypothetical protein
MIEVLTRSELFLSKHKSLSQGLNLSLHPFQHLLLLPTYLPLPLKHPLGLEETLSDPTAAANFTRALIDTLLLLVKVHQLPLEVFRFLLKI